MNKLDRTKGGDGTAVFKASPKKAVVGSVVRQTPPSRRRPDSNPVRPVSRGELFEGDVFDDTEGLPKLNEIGTESWWSLQGLSDLAPNSADFSV